MLSFEYLTFGCILSLAIAVIVCLLWIQNTAHRANHAARAAKVANERLDKILVRSPNETRTESMRGKNIVEFYRIPPPHRMCVESGCVHKAEFSTGLFGAGDAEYCKLHIEAACERRNAHLKQRGELTDV